MVCVVVSLCGVCLCGVSYIRPLLVYILVNIHLVSGEMWTAAVRTSGERRSCVDTQDGGGGEKTMETKRLKAPKKKTGGWRSRMRSRYSADGFHLHVHDYLWSRGSLSGLFLQRILIFMGIFSCLF